MRLGIPLKGIVEQGRAKPLSLTALIDGEAGEDRHGNWEAPRKTFANDLGRLHVLKLAGYERVVAAHRALGVGCHKGADRIASLALSRVAMEPTVERLLAASKSRYLVSRGVVAPR